MFLAIPSISFIRPTEKKEDIAMFIELFQLFIKDCNAFQGRVCDCFSKLPCINWFTLDHIKPVQDVPSLLRSKERVSADEASRSSCYHLPANWAVLHANSPQSTSPIDYFFKNRIIFSFKRYLDCYPNAWYTRDSYSKARLYNLFHIYFEYIEGYRPNQKQSR